MIGQTPITVTGNLTADPELRYTPAGVAVLTFTVASTPRVMNRQTGQWEDGAALFLRVTAWRELAENGAESLAKGTRVTVAGVLTQSNWQDKATGQNRSRVEVAAEDVAVSLRFASARVARAERRTAQRAEPVAVSATDMAGGWQDDAPPF